MQTWLFISIIFVVVPLLIALFFALKHHKFFKNQEQTQAKIPNAKELLESLKDAKNDFNKLQEYANLACMHYEHYMLTMDNFDLEFIALLTSHKNVNAKLILTLEKHFKAKNPERKELLDKALMASLGHR